MCATDDTLADDAHRPAFLGTFTGLPVTGGSATTFGCRLYMSSSTVLRWAVGRGTSTSDDLETSAQLTVTPSSYKMYLALCPPGSAENSLKNVTDGGSHTAIPSLARFPTINRLRYGSSFATQAGTCRIAAVVSASKLWDAEEQTKMTDWLREMMFGRGLTV